LSVIDGHLPTFETYLLSNASPSAVISDSVEFSNPEMRTKLWFLAVFSARRKAQWRSPLVDVQTQYWQFSEIYSQLSPVYVIPSARRHHPVAAITVSFAGSLQFKPVVTISVFVAIRNLASSHTASHSADAEVNVEGRPVSDHAAANSPQQAAPRSIPATDEEQVARISAVGEGQPGS